MSIRLLTGDCRTVLDTLPENSVQMCCTSPPYWGLRRYTQGEFVVVRFKEAVSQEDRARIVAELGALEVRPLPSGRGAFNFDFRQVDIPAHLAEFFVDAEIGSEPTVDEWVQTMVDVFRKVRRVLRDDGVLFLNLGDSYAGSWGAQGRTDGGAPVSDLSANQVLAAPKQRRTGSLDRTPGLKPKDLIGQPWMVAFALCAEGWWLRQEIIWEKNNPLPESVCDRCTKSHEHIFLLSKSERYFWNFDAVQEPVSGTAHARKARGGETGVGFGHGYDEQKKPRHTANVGRRAGPPGNEAEVSRKRRKMAAGRGEGIKNNTTYTAVTSGELRDSRNPRSVWHFPTEAFKGAHFATFPRELARRCITAGSREGDTILDPFAGSGTVGLVADAMHRSAILIDLDERNLPMARDRIEWDSPLFAEVAAE